MTCNLGRLDRGLRILVGIVLIGLAMAGLIQRWGWLGLVPVISAIMGWCPGYMMLGISTRPK
jgi:hypothetical protein